MEDIKQSLKEKTFSFWIRVVLRIMCWVVLMFYMVFRIIIPLIYREPLFLDKNDGYVMSGCICLLLAVEAVRAFFVRYWENKKVD
ncbi:hypothetical protein BFP77_08400 [Maribacter sp. 4U21]|uniref:hypothetical protein n=1 Tax=Maribacter sp. 4U21 TaxID=1889779 RepID=UPI000C15F390|nr:hypothetical protein [Maribacter sp. 4U21]PIB28928.1 hypothetical protein BFP77_08400 [Maribacter sp. 4U21]